MRKFLRVLGVVLLAAFASYVVSSETTRAQLGTGCQLAAIPTLGCLLTSLTGTALTIDSSGDITTSGTVTITNITATTSDSTGALIVGGGIGVVGDIWANGALRAGNNGGILTTNMLYLSSIETLVRNSGTGAVTLMSNAAGVIIAPSDTTAFDCAGTNTSYCTFVLPPITPVTTVSALPAGVAGAQAVVSDALTCTLNGALTGGHSTYCPVYYNGSAWVGG